MAPTHSEIVRGLQTRWNEGDRTADPELFHPDIEFLPARSATEGTYRGLAGMEAFASDTFEVFEKFELHFEFTEVGERVLFWGVIHVRARGSGIETDVETAGVFEFRDDKIVRFEDLGSKEKALAEIQTRD